MNTNFSYLQTPSELYQIKPTNETAFQEVNGRQRRKLFFNLEYKVEQKQQIQKFKIYAKKQGTDLDCDDENICRYLNAEQFNFSNALAKIQEYLQWIHDPTLQHISSKIHEILAAGVIYTYGRDKNYRPIIIMDLTKINFEKYTINQYYCAINALLNVVINYRFVKGVIENYMWIMDLGGQNFTALNLDKLNQIIKKLATVYSMFLGHMLVINAGRLTKILYRTVKGFIHPDTVKKITLLDCSQKDKIKEYISENQMFKKFGGFYENTEVYWPPKNPGLYIKSQEYQKTAANYSEEENSVYYSVPGDRSFFDECIVEDEAASQAICCKQADCTIF